MKIYIASSWKNYDALHVLKSILVKSGHDVDLFCDPHRKGGISYFPKHKDYTIISYLFQEPKSFEIFIVNKKMIEWCDVCILVLPSGKSSHLEAGFAKGIKKILILYNKNEIRGEFEAMYHFADYIAHNHDELLTILKSTIVIRSENEGSIQNARNSAETNKLKLEKSFLS